MKKIALIIPTLRKGGMERVLSVLANKMIKQGFNVQIICLISGVPIEYEIDRGIKVVFPPFEYTQSFSYKFKCIKYLHSEILKFDPDSVLSFSEVFNPLSIFACRLAKKPIFISDRSSPIVKLSTFHMLLRTLSYPFANGILAQTELARKVFIKRKYNRNITVIPNPLREINDLYDKKNNNVVISVGRLVDSKNFRFLLDVFHEYKVDGWKLLILGDGPLFKELDAHIKFLNCEKDITLLGKVDDIDFHMAKASIFAFSSLSEGFPNALNEAMSFPLASIALDCIAGPSDMINNGVNGYLVPINDKKGFGEKLRVLMNNPEIVHQFQHESLKNRELYSADIITSKVVKFILKNK